MVALDVYRDILVPLISQPLDKLGKLRS
ncbi:protein of unknown function [Stenotrophomonas maltophilia]|nr:protein of unknown function [Stenotrophomonas maltophilia]